MSWVNTGNTWVNLDRVSIVKGSRDGEAAKVFILALESGQGITLEGNEALDFFSAFLIATRPTRPNVEQQCDQRQYG